MGLGGKERNHEAPPPKEAEINVGEGGGNGDSSTSPGNDETKAGSDSRSKSVFGESFYARLNLKKGATKEEIDNAYKRQSLKYNKKKNRDGPIAEDKFKEINRAHKVLMDGKKRKIYDKYGSMGLRLADSVGDDNVVQYFDLLESKCFKITSVICCIFTGCCCCCCCFCCFCGCCGLCSKCRPSDDDEDIQDVEGFDGEDETPVSTQPQAAQENDVFLTRTTRTKKAHTECF